MGSCLNGAAFYSGGNPVIVYTGRYKRIDNFWFTVAHEIGHILHHLETPETFFIDNFSDEVKSGLEKDANQNAFTRLKYDEIYAYLKPRLKYLTKPAITACTDELKVHPAVIIGKLAMKIPYHTPIKFCLMRMYWRRLTMNLSHITLLHDFSSCLEQFKGIIDGLNEVLTAKSRGSVGLNSELLILY